MNMALDGSARRLGLIGYKDSRLGNIVYAPIHEPLEVVLEGNCSKLSHKKREVDIILDECDRKSVSPLEFKVVKGKEIGIFVIDGNEDFDEYTLTDSNGEIKIEFIVGCHIRGYDKSDLNLDNHTSVELLSKARELAYGTRNKFGLAKKVFEYVYELPYVKKKAFEGIKTPHQVIKSNLSQDVCLCNSEIFIDLCRVLGIPAREQASDYYEDEERKEYSRLTSEPRKKHLHSYCAFYNRGWHLADPTKGGFDKTFRIGNYYREIFSFRGFDSVKVTAKRL